MREVLTKLARWTFFTVILSLLPLVFDYLLKAKDGSTPSINEVMAHGELALVCTALSGVAAGELFGLTDDAKVAKIALGGICVVSAIVSMMLYVAMRSMTAEGGSVLLDKVSWWLFFETLVTSTIAIGFSEAKK